MSKTKQSIKNDGISSKDKKWLSEHPTRIEVINYVNAFWEKHQLPLITQYIQMSAMVIQALLIDKGICTGDEIEELTKKFIAEQQRRMVTQNNEGQNDEESKAERK